MRRVRLGLVSLTLALAFGGSAWADTATPTPTLSPTPTPSPTPTATATLTPTPTATRTPTCAQGADGTCGGECDIQGYACVWDHTTANLGCTCVIETQSCESIHGGGPCVEGYCDRPPDMIGGTCTHRANLCKCR